MRLFIFSLAAIAIAAPAVASNCSNNDISLAALACEGRFAGNVLSNNGGDVTTQQNALADLGFNWDGSNFGSFPKLSGLGGATTIDFGQLLHGISYVGIHVGGKGGGTTSFYKLDAGGGLANFTLNLSKSSGAVLYSTGVDGVPEPAAWMLMLGGFGAIGLLQRGRARAISFE